MFKVMYFLQNFQLEICKLVKCIIYRQFTTIYHYLLTAWCRVLLEKLTGLQLVKKFPEFYGTRSFITALTSVRHLSLSWASPIQSTYPHPTSWRSILIVSTHLRLGLPSGLFPSGFPTKTLYTPLLTHTRHMPSTSHSSRYIITVIKYIQSGHITATCFDRKRSSSGQKRKFLRYNKVAPNGVPLFVVR